MKRIYLFFAMLLMLSVTVFTSCENELPPTVLSKSITDITDTSCMVHAEVTDHGGSVALYYGVCWDTKADPDTATSPYSMTPDEYYFLAEITTGMGISGLEPETKYYVRPFAINLFGIGYGECMSFTTLPSSVAELPVVSTDEVQ